MKFCKNCGYGVDDNLGVCGNCNTAMDAANTLTDDKLNSLADRVRINGYIWIAIGILQLFCIYSIPLGLWNIYSAFKDLKIAKEMPVRRVGLVQAYEPLGGPIFYLLLNLVLGAGFGVIGSLYYIICIRGYVMENKEYFNTLR